MHTYSEITLMNDLRAAAKRIMKSHNDPNIRDETSQPTIVALASHYLAQHPDEPDVPCDLDWLESRGWKILPRSTTDGHGAQIRAGSIGPFNRFIQIDQVGSSITAMKPKEAVAWTLAGLNAETAPRMFVMPITAGWPSRRIAVMLEQFARVLGGGPNGR